MGNLDPIKYTISLAHPSPYPKWHLIFVGLTIVTDQQTDRPPDHATPSVTTGHIYAVLQCA